jgi:hypothetical protein
MQGQGGSGSMRSREREVCVSMHSFFCRFPSHDNPDEMEDRYAHNRTEDQYA